MKINFHKSEIFLFGDANDKGEVCKNIFTCKVVDLPIKYLRVSLNKVRTRNRDWKPVKNKVENRCACWYGKMLNMAGRINLIQSSLSSLPMFMMSFYPISMGVKKAFVDLGFLAGR